MEGENHKVHIDIQERFVVDEGLIIETLERIEEKFENVLTKRKKRNLYTTITELVQNINNYTEDASNNENKLEIGCSANGSFVIVSENLLNKFNKDSLEEKLNKLKGLDKDQMNKMYDDALHNGKDAQDRRNGLGIILIVKNANKLDYSFDKISLNLYKFKLRMIFD